MSFREISIAVRAENRASSVFRTIGGDVISLGHSFGLLDSNMGRAVSAFMSMTHLLISLKGVLGATTTMQVAQTAAVGSTAVAHGSGAGATIAHSAALAGYTASAGAATAATTGLGIALSSLMGPLGLILGLAAAMGALAYASNMAADSEKRLREELEKLRPRERTYSRAGEEELRRGIE